MWKKELSPWVTGAIISFLFAIALYLFVAPIGSINAYYRLYTYIIELYEKGKFPPMDWDIVFLIFVIIGAFIGSIIKRDF